MTKSLSKQKETLFVDRQMKKIINNILLILFAGLTVQELHAQKLDQEHLNVSVYTGDTHMLNALHIYDKLINTKDCIRAGVTVGVNTKPSDNNYWAWAWNLPQYGLGFSYTNMGGIKCRPGSSLGDVYSLYGHAHFDIVRTRHFTFGPNMEFGASYITKTWNAVTNPLNSFVGTPVLVMVGMGLEAGFHLTPQWEIGLNAMLIHRSNGMLKVPNHGLNEIAGNLYLKYNLAERHLGGRGPKPEEPEYRKWIYDIYFSGGVHSCDVERSIYQDIVLPEKGGPDEWANSKQWLRLNLGGTVSYRYHPLFATGIGLDLTYTQNWKRLAEYGQILAKHEGTVPTTTDLCPVYLGAYIQQSFFYKNVEIGIGLGIYLFKRLGIEDSTWNYQRTLIRYHIPKAGNIFFGFAMRAHKFDRSDTLEFSFGKRF